MAVSMHDIHWTMQVSSAPATEPITTAEAKKQSYIDTDDDDDFIDDNIQAAREYLQEQTNTSFITQTRVMRMDRFPDTIKIPFSPLISVTSITYVDTNGDTQTLSSSLYDVDIYRKPARINPAYGESWPSTRLIDDAITLTYVAGYANAAAVPALIKKMMLFMAAHYYENREILITGTIVAKIPETVESLIAMNRINPEW